jgi:hypothetical protein
MTTGEFRQLIADVPDDRPVPLAPAVLALASAVQDDAEEAAAVVRYLLNPTIDEIVGRMKAEILADVRAGRVPADVPDYSALHDHVDANCYGLTEALWQVMDARAGADTDDAHAAVRDRLFDLMNAAMDRVDAWLKAGGLSGSVRQD